MAKPEERHLFMFSAQHDEWTPGGLGELDHAANIVSQWLESVGWPWMDASGRDVGAGAS